MSNDSKVEPKPNVVDDAEKNSDEKTDALSDADLDKVAGGTFSSTVSGTVKNIGDALSSMARKG